MELDRYTLLGFFAVVVVPATLVGGAVYAMSKEPTKPKAIETPTAVMSTSPKVEVPTITEKVAERPVELVKGWTWTNPSDMFLKLSGVKIKNNTNQDIKDPEIYCSAFGESGTAIDSNSREQFKIIKAGETIDLGSVDMGFLRSQADKVGCRISNYKKV